MMKSNFFGCSTERAASFAAFRISRIAFYSLPTIPVLFS
jgi:hypothetical protein